VNDLFIIVHHNVRPRRHRRQHQVNSDVTSICTGVIFQPSSLRLSQQDIPVANHRTSTPEISHLHDMNVSWRPGGQADPGFKA
jgi:hypothetical protein